MSGIKHEGVSCDACMKSNFRGRRYKCLMCYDYDLCGSCRDAKTVSGRHTMDHPMQCILARADMEIYYGGETITFDQGQSFTCPYCGEMGLNETDLAEHVGLKHPNSINDVICPICSTMQGGDPNHVTEDLLAHLSTDHQPNSESAGGRTLGIGRGRFRRAPSGASTARAREQRRFGPTPGAGSQSQSALSRTSTRESADSAMSNGMDNAASSVNDASSIQHLLPPPSALASTVRENVDSIADFAELLSQLTNVRRSGPGGGPSQSSLLQQQQLSQPPGSATGLTASFASTASSLQQLQMQLQMERQNLLFGRVDNMRNSGTAVRTPAPTDPSRPLDARLTAAYMNTLPFGDPRQTQPSAALQQSAAVKAKKEREGQSLLDKLLLEKTIDDRQDDIPRQRADRALFIQELLIGTLNDAFDMNALGDEIALQVPPPMERENSMDSVASSSNFSTTATMGSSRAGSEFAFPVDDVSGASQQSDRRGGPRRTINNPAFLDAP